MCTRGCGSLTDATWNPVLQAVKQLLELPLNLTIVSPAHTPNWDLVSDVVNSCSRIYRSSKQCRSRYENVLIPREEGKVRADPSHSAAVELQPRAWGRPVRQEACAAPGMGRAQLSWLQAMRDLALGLRTCSTCLENSRCCLEAPVPLRACSYLHFFLLLFLVFLKILFI